MALLLQRVLQPSRLRRLSRWRRILVSSTISSDVLVSSFFSRGCFVGSDKLVIKAQVLAGGRGKGHFDNGFQGGVQMVDR